MVLNINVPHIQLMSVIAQASADGLIVASMLETVRLNRWQ